MILSKFLEILISPDNKTSLTYNNEENYLISADDNFKYHFADNVPVLLPTSSYRNDTTELHKDFNSSFNYIEHYQEDAKQFDYFTEYECGASNFENDKLKQIIISRVPRNSDLILDIGCGKGWVADYFLNLGKSIISMDISLTNPLRISRKHNENNHLGLVADVYSMPFKENSIDCVISSEVMEHVPNPKLYIEEIVKVLKPGGKAVITTPYNEKLQYYLCVHCNKLTPKNAHLHSFNDNNIKELLPQTGCEIKIEKAIEFNLMKLRTHIILKYFPFSLWKLIDKIACKILRRPDKYIIEIIKDMIL